MKKFTLIFLILFGLIGISVAQVIENYEVQKMNLFSNGNGGGLSVVPNPDPTGANTSAMVCKWVIGGTGRDPWAGWYGPATVDVTTNKYVHMLIWKNRKSPVDFKLEVGDDPNTGDIYPMNGVDNGNATTGAWEELVFDFTAFTGTYKQIVPIPDFENPLTTTEDQTLYFDYMYVNNDPAVGSAPVVVLEDFEHIPQNIMLGDPLTDMSSFELVPNPDKSGIDLSDYVMKLHRDKDGVPWCGFWGKVADYPAVGEIDITTNKYVHYKVWKPRVSPCFFKLEGGTDGTSERESATVQTKTNAWEDIVFDFSDMTGTYPIIALMPDKLDPVGLDDDIDIYFDDIVVNNDPNPVQPTTQTILVDMNGAGLTAGQTVWISGAFGGAYGTWNEPGTNAGNQMFSPNNDGIYQIDMHLPAGAGVQFKFFIDPNWNTGDPFNNRTADFDGGNVSLSYEWGVGGVTVGKKENPLAGKIQMYPNPVKNVLSVNSTSELRNAVITSTLGKVVGNYTLGNKGNQTINTSTLSNGMYFVTFVDKSGNKVTQKLIKY
jgi:hypothetical protein